MQKLAIQAAAALVAATLAGPALAAEAIAVPEREWSFSGIFGAFDKAEKQRGLQVYKEVCASCHGMSLINFRNLAALGYSDDEIKALAAEYEVEDDPDDDGEMFFRQARASDAFPSPFANEKAARAANGGAYPPDLSLMAKARAGGPDYLHALLTGYQDEPPAAWVEENGEMQPGMYYNDYFPGHQIAMAPPLYEDGVEYADGTPATIDQQATDVSAFLMWAAEPHLDERKHMGLRVLLFLLVFTGLLYAVKRKVWAKLH